MSSASQPLEGNESKLNIFQRENRIVKKKILINWIDGLTFGIVTGPVGCSFCAYGLSSYNYLSNGTKTYIIRDNNTTYILCTISFESSTELVGNILLPHFLIQILMLIFIEFIGVTLANKIIWVSDT